MSHQILWKELGINFGGIIAFVTSYIPWWICEYFKILFDSCESKCSELLFLFFSVYRPATVLPGSGQPDDSGNA